MRRQLLAATLAAAGVALVLLGVPLGLAVRTLLADQELATLRREAEQAQLLLERTEATTQQAGVFLRILAENSGARYTLLTREGVVLVDSGGVPSGARAVSPDIESAATDGAGELLGGGVAAVSLRVPGSGLIVRTAKSDVALRQQVRSSWLAIAALGVVALGAAALLAGRQSSRLARPLEELARSAQRLGLGDFSARAPSSGVPELDEVAQALDLTAARLGTTLERSRSFGADASHQLRTPLTALRLDLEALEAVGAHPELVQAAFTEADRLEQTIEELATLAEPDSGEEVVDLGELAAARLDAWQALARAQGRRVVLQAAPVDPVRARPAALGQSLQVLLDNALEHGRGTITVTVQSVAGGARLCVADEGEGIPLAREVNLLSGWDGRRGRGLPLARSLVEAEGGRLRIERARPGAMLCLVLPTATGPAPAPPSVDPPDPSEEPPGRPTGGPPGP